LRGRGCVVRVASYGLRTVSYGVRIAGFGLRVASLLIVIPAEAGIQICFNTYRHWMPDQVRHDGQNLRDYQNY
jgi:hypothetical protein